MGHLRLPSLLCLVTLACGGPMGGAGARPGSHMHATPAVVIVSPELRQIALDGLGDHPELRVVLTEDGSSSGIEDAVVALEQARRFYVAMEFGRSLSVLEPAIVSLESQAETREDFDHLARALILRATNEFFLERMGMAAQSWLLAARLRPELELSEEQYPPLVREAFAAQQAIVRAEHTGSLTVTVEPVGARILLDGEDKGLAPQTIYGTSGRHQLRAEAIGFAPRTLAVSLSAEPTEPLTVSLPRADESTAARQVRHLGVDDELAEASRHALARLFGVSRVIDLRAESAEGISASVIDLESGTVSMQVAHSLAALVDRPDVPEGAFSSSAPSTEGGASRRSIADRSNEAFFARLAAGPALIANELSLEGPATMEPVSGTSAGLDLELAAGGSPMPGLVLGGSVSLRVNATELEVDAVSTDRAKIRGGGGLGIFVAWYPSAHGGWNLYTSFSAWRAVVNLGDDRTFVGPALALGGGHEWWFSSEFAAGAFLRVSAIKLTGDGGSLSALSLSLLGTVTYN